jgi:hypothetical protein
LNNESYTFVRDNSILNLKDNEFVTRTSTMTNNEKNLDNKKTTDDIIRKKKIHSKKVKNKGRKVLGKCSQGYSPIYE